ncbi:MAG: glycosyltransferase family 1 protein [Chloroflexota bacterium]
MLIGIDASRAAIPKRTGTEAYAYHLIQHLLPLAQERGHTVRLYFNHPPADNLFEDYPNVAYHIIPFPRFWTHFRLGLELFSRPPDLFFTPAHVIPYTWRGRAMATIHDLGYEFFPEAHTPKQVRHLRWGTQHNAKRSQKILADSEATKRDLVDLYRIQASKIDVVYPGIDPEFILEANAAQKLKREKPYYLFLSTIQPRKNVARIIQAFAQIAERVSHDLILAGQIGWRASQTQQALDSLTPAVREQIELVGFVPDEEKAGLIKGASAFIYPSLYEGFGFPLLEANACGVPVIAANTSSLAELTSTGGAYRVDPENTDALAQAMVEILENNGLRTTLIAAGYKNIERFSWQQTAEKVLNLMEACL